MMKLSEQKEMLEGLNIELLDEHGAYIQKEKVIEVERYDESQATLLERVKAIGQSNVPALILTAEKSIVKNELRKYGNSSSMKGSLKAAVKEMTAAEKLIAVVQDPAAYKFVNESHALPRSRTEGVPRDEARKSISSHYTRLLNLDKSRMTGTEKKTLKARRSNLRLVEKLYTAMQHQALGTTPPEKSRKRGLER